MNTLRLFRAALHLALALICIPATALAESDIPGGKDHPMFSRIPGYYISAYKEEEFAAYDFTNEKGEEVTVEGQLTEITYTLPDSAPRAVLRAFGWGGFSTSTVSAMTAPFSP